MKQPIPNHIKAKLKPDEFHTMLDHICRFQAQDNVLQESESWAQSSPITLSSGKKKLHKLRDRLTPADLKVRKKAFEKCETFINNAAKNGGLGLTPSKSFYDDPKYRIVRVDLEVNAGLAFVMP